MTLARVVRAIRNTVTQARRHAAVVQFSAEDATRAERTFLKQCAAMVNSITAVQAGAGQVVARAFTRGLWTGWTEWTQWTGEIA